MLLDILSDPQLAGHRPGQTLIADKNYYGAGFEAALAATDVHLLRSQERTGPLRRSILQTPQANRRVDP